MDWRYEIKYSILKSAANTVPVAIDLHPEGFVRAFPDRTVNNLYLDTLSATACRENLDGVSDRVKYRIRWYGDPYRITNPVLELKIKSNALGRKEYHMLDDSKGLSGILEQVKDINSNTFKLVPTLHNSYLRSYFLTADKKFRLTVDRNIQYQSGVEFVMGNVLSIPDDRLVLEIKFSSQDILHSKRVTRFIPYRVTKHSKYASGLLACTSYR